MQTKNRILSAFSSDHGVSKALILLFISINAIVLFNAIFHDPRIGYDMAAFLLNIDVLSEFRIPLESDTTEFFTPPLPFILPALFEAIMDKVASPEFLSPPNTYWFPTFLHYRFLQSVPLYIIQKFSLGLAAKFAQLLNVFYSLILTFFLLKIGKHVQPKKLAFRFLSLGFLGIMPVYYKSFAFVRPEPLLAALGVLAAYVFLDMLNENKAPTKKLVLLGVILGLEVLARQWGFFSLAAIGIFMIIHAQKNNLGLRYLSKSLTVMFGTAFLVGGWFYLHLISEYGSPIAYNLEPIDGIAINSHPAEFYFGFKLDKLFSDPIKPVFQSSFIPIFYTEFWGDYDQFFKVYGVDNKHDVYIDGNYINTRELQMQNVPVEDRRWLSNLNEINAYLGRVNMAALLPTAVMLAGIVLGLRRTYKWTISKSPASEDATYAFATLLVTISSVAFFWFLIKFSYGNATTAKATYMLHMFPFLALLSAGGLLELGRYSKRALLFVLFLLGLVVLHNLPMFFTNYNTWVLSNIP